MVRGGWGAAKGSDSRALGAVVGISGAGIDLDTDDTGVEESGIEIKGSGTADGFSVDETGIGIEVSSAVDVFCVDKTGLEVKDLGAIDGFCVDETKFEVKDSGALEGFCVDVTGVRVDFGMVEDFDVEDASGAGYCLIAGCADGRGENLT